jgi:acyl-coenzyme A synthetase/AMP-(fatty) acid ligase
VSGTVTQTDALSPAPILEAVERYRGAMIDLDTARVLGPDEFARSREALIKELRRQGLRSGDRVVLAVANGPLFIAALTSILACEGSPLLLHHKTPPAELRRYAERFNARFLACDPTDEPGFDAITSPPVEIAFGEVAALRWSALNVDNGAQHGPLLRGVPLHPTSGSTGLPKIALRPGFAAVEEARHYAETMDVEADDFIMAVPPMSHAYGYGMCVMLPLLTGASIVSTRRFTVTQVHRALAEHPITILPTVPAMLDVLSFGSGADLRNLRWVLAAGAMMPGRSAEKFRAKTGVTPCPLYGTTETGGISVATAADGRDVDGRVGPSMEGVSVRVQRPEGNSDLGADIGILQVRSSSMMTGYLDHEGRISTPMTDGWFATGDLARIGEDGMIHLRGRDSEVINVAGLKVVPCEVEEAITAIPGVVEIKVYAGNHVSGTQIVKAAIVVQNGLTTADIRAHCEQHLVYYKQPQVITLLDALPRNPAGKIIRDQLP